MSASVSVSAVSVSSVLLFTPQLLRRTSVRTVAGGCDAFLSFGCAFPKSPSPSRVAAISPAIMLPRANRYKSEIQGFCVPCLPVSRGVRVEKTLHSDAHGRLVALLVAARRHARLTQAELAARLDRPQQFVSNYESGQRRIDLVELAAICDALGLRTSTLVRRWENAG